MAVPRGGQGPGIVLCQEIFGINGFIREVADYYAEEGYTVVAPDLFWRIQPGIELGYTEQEWQKAFELFQKFDTDKGMSDITATVKAMRTMPQVQGKVGALGFCLGGPLPHYGRQSWLAFDGARAIDKGVWSPKAAEWRFD